MSHDTLDKRDEEAVDVEDPRLTRFDLVREGARRDGVEIVHWFPLLQPAQPAAQSFRPRRWAAGHSKAEEPFDPFLGGSRACPGKSLILFVCKVAMAELLVSRPLALACAALDVDALPMELPAGLPRFAPLPPHQVPT